MNMDVDQNKCGGPIILTALVHGKPGGPTESTPVDICMVNCIYTITFI